MSWERDPLWAKARLFFERAFNEDRDNPLFGLWCSIGIELLGRAALASISPTLLAEPDREHKHLLHALSRPTKGLPRSITTAQVFALCRTLFNEFSDEDNIAVAALTNCRNTELHTGTAAFAAYPSRLWLSGFYRAARSLTLAVGESLESLFGKVEAKVAKEVLEEIRDEVKQRVLSTISAHKKVFFAKDEKDRIAAAENAKKDGEKLAHLRHHRVTCPSCECTATVHGRAFGQKHTTFDGDEIVVRQSVSPHTFECMACGLKLKGYAELDSANLGGHYTRTTSESPQDYYGLIDPESLDVEDLVQQFLEQNPNYLQDQLGGMEYDNE